MPPNIYNSFRSLLTVAKVEIQFMRYGHQRCTHNKCKHPKPKHRGIKRNHGEEVHAGEVLMTQRQLRLHPGINVVACRGNLSSQEAGRVCITAEEFDPNFESDLVTEHYSHIGDQKVFKKYMHVIPDPQHNRFKLVDVV